MDELIKRLQSLQSKYYWTIGSTITGDFTCSIWERDKWREEGRITINASGKSFEEAMINALKKVDIK